MTKYFDEYGNYEPYSIATPSSDSLHALAIFQPILYINKNLRNAVADAYGSPP